MPKHNLPKEIPSAKRRRQSIISDENTNPLGEDGVSQCFRKVEATMYVSIPPVYSQTPLEGIAIQNLDPLIMRYYAPGNGVVVAYSDLRNLGQDENGDGPKVAKIIAESPFAFTWVKANLLMWSPTVGDTLDGYISAQSPGHIALLINDTFNATIKRDDIPPNWTFVHGEQDEECSQPGSWADESGNTIEAKLRFTVKAFNTSGRTVHVIGSLLTIADVNQVYQKQPKHTKFEDIPSSLEKVENAVASDTEPKYGSAESSSSSSDSDSSSDDDDESEDES